MQLKLTSEKRQPTKLTFKTFFLHFLYENALLFTQPLSAHEDLNLYVERKCSIILSKSVQVFGVFKHGPLITHYKDEKMVKYTICSLKH